MSALLSDPVEIVVVRGDAIDPFLGDAARLRRVVFREWPYLYEGDEASEGAYLQTYRDHPDSLFVVARAGGEVVGLAQFEEPSSQQTHWFGHLIPRISIYIYI